MPATIEGLDNIWLTFHFTGEGATCGVRFMEGNRYLHASFNKAGLDVLIKTLQRAREMLDTPGGVEALRSLTIDLSEEA